MAKIGIEWVNDYHGRADDLSNCKKEAEKFYNELSGTRSFNWGDDSAWDRDLEEAGRGVPADGFDSVWADNVHILFFSGHGNTGGAFFGIADKDDGRAHYKETVWGNGILNWIAFSACKILYHNPYSKQFLSTNISAATCKSHIFSPKVYFFSGDYYIRYNWKKHKVDSGYPKVIQEEWKNWPSSFSGGIDASVLGAKSRNGKVYFFKGDKYIRHDWGKGKVDSGYPKNIKDHWGGFPDHFTFDLDAALLGGGDRKGKAYFFKGAEYIRYDWGKHEVDPGYPKLIKDQWADLPLSFAADLDAALPGYGSRRGKAYFFKGDEYVRYDWDKHRADSGYPKNIVAQWPNWPRGDDDVFFRWKRAFGGLHAMLGFYTTCTDSSKRGKYFAENLNDGQTVIEAWRKACIETEGSGRKWAYLRGAGGSGVNTYNDHWFGRGTVSPDPDNTMFAYGHGSC